MAKIGIMGGTFDPIHIGHIQLGKTAYQQMGLDRVLFMPNHVPWMKRDRMITKDEIRAKMVALAIEDDAHFEMSTIEMDAGGNSYTYETIQSLKLMYPDDQLYFIMGADSLFTFHQWYHPEVILQHANLLVASRDHSIKTQLLQTARDLIVQYGGQIEFLDMDEISISSTHLREAIANWDMEMLEQYLDPKVIAYIDQHQLYRDFSTDNTRLKTIRKSLKKTINSKRYTHTLGVAYTAVNLAMAHDVWLYDAFLAGLLHDCAKCLSADEKLSLCDTHGIQINEAEKANLDLLHAKLGAIVAKEEYQVTDADILSAIAYHTTGKPDMTTLEKIIYIADYIEPNRKPLPNLDLIRKIAFEDLDQAMVMTIEGTLSYLQSMGAMIDATTQETYDYYVALVQQEKGI